LVEQKHCEPWEWGGVYDLNSNSLGAATWRITTPASSEDTTMLFCYTWFEESEDSAQQFFQSKKIEAQKDCWDQLDNPTSVSPLTGDTLNPETLYNLPLSTTESDVQTWNLVPSQLGGALIRGIFFMEHEEFSGTLLVEDNAQLDVDHEECSFVGNHGSACGHGHHHD
jgi:hypothetical protein